MAVPNEIGANGATMLPGASLAAWWLAQRIADAPTVDREHLGSEAACGIVAAGYLVALASKVWTSGLAWASAGNIALQVATQDAVMGGPLSGLRQVVVESPMLCGAFGVATLFIEGSAVLFVVPRFRLPAAVVITSMHIGISVLMGLHHYDWMFTKVGWALIGRPRAA